MAKERQSHPLQIGRHRVTVIRDTTFDCPIDVLLSAGQRPRWEPLVQLDARRRIPLPVNCLLIESDGRKILVDGGDGVRRGRPKDENGRLLDRLAALDISRDQIDTVVLTHAHSDHIAGLVTPGPNGLETTFPAAEHLIARAEAERMADPARRGPRSPGLAPYDLAAAAAYDVLAGAGSFRAMGEGEAIGAGITLLAAPGHAAGHSAVLVEDGDECLLFLADVLHFSFEFEHLEFHGDFDADPEQVVVDRKAMIRLALDRDAIVAASHLHELAFRLEYDGSGRVIGSTRCP
jgi:glyoxylase-like metal-dependent hydrolase (beta-lactamase superfamily II)